MDKKTAASTEADPRQEKKRGRWRRNKRVERARKKTPPPLPPSEEFVWRVMAERDRRRENYPYWLTWNIDWHDGRGTFEFQTDVWSARTILAAQFGKSNVTAGKIARWMSGQGLNHGYKPNSLRTMVYRALEAIEIMETYATPRRPVPHWPAFTPED
jgi:hypothetical protein